MNNQQFQYYNIAIQYANDCIIDNIPACIETKQACERFLNDIDNPLYYINHEAINHVCNFIQYLRLTDGSGTNFVLQPWQIHILTNVYGLYKHSNNLRKYSYSAVEIPRKNGKSELLCALATYHFVFDKKAFVTLSANSREQIKLTDFPKVKEFSLQLDRTQKQIVHYYNSLIYKDNILINTANSPEKLDGLNISCGIIDEIHEAKDLKMYNIIKRAMGSRTERMLHLITTAGLNSELPYYQILRTYYKDILNKKIVDESQFCIIYTLDPEDDYNNKEVWGKANPNLGISKSIEYMEQEIIKAKNSIGEETELKVKDFNIWLKNSQLEKWIPDQYIKQAFQNIELEMFKDSYSFAGADLASVSDLTALSILIKKDSKYFFKNYYYLPEDSLNTSVNKLMFKEMADKGFLKLTPGNVTDYDFLMKELERISSIVNITSIAYDKFNATQWAIEATQKGYWLEQFNQGYGTYNQPTKEFEKLTLSSKVVIDSNPLTSWMINNVVIKVDHNLNQKPDRTHRNKKIDGVMSMLMALGSFLKSQQ